MPRERSLRRFAPPSNSYDDGRQRLRDSRNRLTGADRAPRDIALSEAAATTTQPPDRTSILEALSEEIFETVPPERREAMRTFAKLLLHRLADEEVETLGVQ